MRSSYVAPNHLRVVIPVAVRACDAVPSPKGVPLLRKLKERVREKESRRFFVVE